MSRTLKDRPSKIQYPRYWENDGRGEKTKKPRHVDTEWNWLGSTPSWWTHLMMNRPMRARGRAWERKVLSNAELEPPTVSKKPHAYYW